MTNKPNDNREWFIYTLNDPRTNEVRYVGWTCDVGKRLSDHIYKRNKAPTYKNNWIKQLESDGLIPTINVIESGFGNLWADVEIYWILHYRMQGARLTNMTDGGEGALGLVLTDEQKAKIGASSRGYKHSLEAKEKMSKVHKGKKLTPEQREVMRIRGTKRKLSEETKRRMSEERKGIPKSEEHRAKIREMTALKRKVTVRIEDGKVFPSLGFAAAEMGVYPSSIRMAIIRKRLCKGYHWRYQDEIR